MKPLWSPHARDVRIWVSTVLKIMSLKTEIARSVSGPKLQGPRAEDAMAEPYLVQKMLVTWSQQITKFSVKIVNLETIFDMQSSCRTWPPNGSSRIRAKQKLHRKHREAYKSSWSLVGSLKSFFWQFLRIWQSLWRSFLESLHVYTTPIGDQWYCRKSSAQSKGRYICSIVAISLNENWWADPWNVTLICETSQIYHLMGRRPKKDVLGNHLKDRLFHLVHWLSIILQLRRTSQESINLERKSYLDCSSDTHCTRGEFGRVAYWLQTWGVGDGGRIGNLLEKTQCERGDISQTKRRIYFPIADGRIKLSGGDQELRTSTLIRNHPIRGESRKDFLGEPEGCLPPPQDSFPDAGEAINDFGSMSGNFIYRHHVEPRVKLYSPREESFLIPLKYIDVSRTTHINLDVMQERRIEIYWNVDGSRDLSDPWTGFTQFTLLEGKPPNGYMWSGGRLTKRQVTSRPDYLWPELWIKMARNAKLKEKQKWSNEKPKLDNARRLRGIFFLDPEDKVFRETIRNARKKLETPMAPVMPCNTCKKSKRGEIRSKTNEFKSKLACILEASESTRLRMEESLPNYHEDHSAGRGDNSPQHDNLVHKFIPMPQAMKIPAAKAAVDIKNGRNWKRFRRGTWRKPEVKKRWSMKQGRRAQKFILFHWWTYFIWKNAELEAKHQKYKGRVVLRGDIVKDDSGSYAVFKEQGSSASQMAAAKIMDIISRLPGCSGQAADAVSAYTQVKMEDAPKILKIPKSECPDIWIRLPRHKWPKSWSSMEDPVVPLERNLYGHLLAGLLWERQIEKTLLQHGWEKVSKLGMSLCTSWKRIMLICVRGWHKIGWKEIKYCSDVESIQ